MKPRRDRPHTGALVKSGGLALLLAGPAALATSDPPSPEAWIVGDWFRFVLAIDDSEPVSGDLVVVDANASHLELGLRASHDVTARVLTSGLVPLSWIPRDSWAFDSLGKTFRPWSETAAWTTHLRGHPVAVEAQAFARDQATLTLTHPREGGTVGSARFETRPSLLREFHAHGASFLVTATGSGHEGEAHRIVARDVVLRFGTDVGPVTSAGPASFPWTQGEAAAPRMALHGRIPSSNSGVFALDVSGPHGAHYAISNLAGAPPATTQWWNHAAARGAWSASRLEVGGFGVSVIGVAYDPRPVSAPSNPPAPTASWNGSTDASPAEWLALAIGLGVVGLSVRRGPRILWVLFTRLVDAEVRRNAIRRAVVETLRAQEVATAAALRESLGVSRSTLEYHLAVLRRWRLVRAHRFGRVVCWTLAESGDHGKSRWFLGVLPGLRAVFDQVRREPGANLSQVARSLGVHHSTVQFHVDRLTALGVIVRARHGREVRLRPA